MAKKINLTGKRFGKLVVTSFAFYSKEKRTNYWNCKCDCGNTTVAAVYRLTSGQTKSCGCYKEYVKKQLFGGHHITHGYSHHPICNTYYSMKGRCYNKNNVDYKNYGGRGIKVCDEWLKNSGKFVEWSLNNGWKPGLSIDRIDTNGDYEPSNCRWATTKQQNNNRRNTCFIEYEGRKRTISE